MADVSPHAPSAEDDFATLATPKKPGEPLTNAEYSAAERTVKRFWPKGGKPHELPEEYR
ncbi:MAG: hypothetical protein ACRDNK_11770 [Solirubrobacteraceae bacterium]